MSCYNVKEVYATRYNFSTTVILSNTNEQNFFPRASQQNGQSWRSEIRTYLVKIILVSGRNGQYLLTAGRPRYPDAICKKYLALKQKYYYRI